jgi:uncharacterized protein YdeI (YjbR/CyaY-like superfamily)
MLKKGEHIEGTPAELQVLLDQEPEANEFFESLSKSYKQGYCDWVGSAKQEETRKVRADKAMIMLRNKQKTLKTQFAGQPGLLLSVTACRKQKPFFRETQLSI